MERLGWAFDHRDVDAVAGLLAADLAFRTFETDSAGNPSAGAVWTRDSVLVALRSLLDGVPGGQAPAAGVQLALDPNLVPFPDGRVGRNPHWHAAIRTSVDLRVKQDADNELEVAGYAVFYLTRGDSAAIPADQAALGARPDSSRWWISGLDDETLGGGLRATGARKLTFGDILRLYLDRARR